MESGSLLPELSLQAWSFLSKFHISSHLLFIEESCMASCRLGHLVTYLCLDQLHSMNGNTALNYVHELGNLFILPRKHVDDGLFVLAPAQALLKAANLVFSFLSLEVCSLLNCCQLRQLSHALLNVQLVC